jgi:CBS domain-containing protein
MKAADLMTTNVVTIADDATAQDAAVLMLGNRISALPVLDRSGKLVGIVSEGDLMRRSELGTERERSWWLELLTANRNLASDYVKAHGRKVSEVMTRKLITATPTRPSTRSRSSWRSMRSSACPFSIMASCRHRRRANLLQA